MRGLLTGGVKAILAIAALSTAAHWAMRVQRDPAPSAPKVAALPDPVTTGSIEPRRVERPAVEPVRKDARLDKDPRLDQDHLSALIASTTGPAPKTQKTVAKR